MKKLKQTKGITLIALIITIIILLILAVVSIRLVMNSGIISKSEYAVDKYREEEKKEQSDLAYAEYQMAKLQGEANPTLTITAAQSDKMLSETTNSTVYDEYGNKIVIPAGFKMKVDADTNNATHVTEGIVVTDGTNEFVWIPVGNIKTSKEDTTGTPITLSRYTFDSNGTPTDKGDAAIDTYFQELSTSTYGNATAKNINAFVNSANSNCGYYLGRYEARTATERTTSEDPLTDVTENKNDYVYNYVTQPQASERCQRMYTGKPFTSDLINSYAWDTAIVFIQTFGENSTYSRKPSVNKTYSNTGTTEDKISNIYDMASNCYEWSTETYSDSDFPCVVRGGSYGNSNNYTSDRGCLSSTFSDELLSFRPLLYM